MKESNELDEVDRRLLAGIVQEPPKEKKRWDKEDPEERRIRKKAEAEAAGFEYQDSYDDETEGSDVENELTRINEKLGIDGSSTDLMSGKNMMNKMQAARGKILGRALADDKGGEVQLPCPDGYDPVKWASMSRKDKMKVLGISEKEWDKMTREQQMKRMNKLAHGFHFYAMNKK